MVEMVKIYYLVMNPVTDRAETGRITAASFYKESLINFYNNEFTEPYDDDRFRKVFKKGGPLEWFNPLWTLENLDSFGHGLKEDWVDTQSINSIKNQYYFV